MKDEIHQIVLEHCTGWKNCEALTEQLFNLYNSKQNRKLLIKQVDEYIEKVQIDTNIEVGKIERIVIKFK